MQHRRWRIRASGYGIGSEQVDGNDPVAMLAVMDEAARFVRSGNGPVVVEAHTYRIDAHTNADDATRYRDSAEVEAWLGRDPLPRLEKYLRANDLIDDAFVESLTEEAEAEAATLQRAGNECRPPARSARSVPVRLRRADTAIA